MKRIVLASSSPRRKEILEKYIDNFEIVTSEVKEIIMPDDDPIQLTMALAFQKAESVAKKIDYPALIIAADTVVYLNKILGKPKDEEDAYEILNSLSGKIHYVISGISIYDTISETKVIDYEITKVKFRELQSEKIIKYIETGEVMDKAGAYAIQGYGEILVDWIEGSYSNIVGLPITKLDKLLERHFKMKLL